MTASNIVERLRAVAAMDLRTGGFLAHTLDTAAMAADEIERLRAALKPFADLARAHKDGGQTRVSIGLQEYQAALAAYEQSASGEVQR